MQKFTVSLVPITWLAFCIRCLQHHTTASAALRRLIAAQLAAWEAEDALVAPPPAQHAP